jgi:2'-5' RNA ligase
MSLRLFTAIAVPSDIQDRLAAMQRGIPGASWRPKENFHITLAFHGDVDEAKARDLDLELSQIVLPPMEVKLQGIGWFGGLEPNNLWIGAEPFRGLSELASKCERAAKRVGLEVEKRKFTPHVTLAYLRGTPAKECAMFAQKLNLYKSAPFLVDMFYLYSSHLGKGPSQYEEEAAYPLTGKPPAPRV